MVTLIREIIHEKSGGNSLFKPGFATVKKTFH